MCMNVTLLISSGQALVLRHAGRNILSTLMAGVAILALAAGGARAETHTNLQSITAAGTSAWGGSAPLTLTGVLLCDPDEMLDSTPNFIHWNNGSGAYQMGAEWQIAFQTVDTNDWGGTFCYMGQCYGNMPYNANDDLSYSNAAWSAEILRLEYDPETLHEFQAGDLIQVTARATSFYGGKRNITEEHYIDPADNFTISLVTSKYGLPDPQVITLADIKNANDTFIFDQTRATGGEHYQAMRVRINNLTLTTTNGWNATNAWGNRKCTATDGTGRTFFLRHSRRDIGPAPTGTFDAIGIFNQESGSGSQGTNGYELIVQGVVPQAAQTLAIAQKAAITWPVSGAAYVVEYSTDLSSTNWCAVTNVPVVIEGQNTVLDSMTNTHRFYRLRKTN
jgi:hypothetical protein